MFNLLISILLLKMTYDSNKLKKRICDLEKEYQNLDLIRSNLELLIDDIDKNSEDLCYEENFESL